MAPNKKGKLSVFQTIISVIIGIGTSVLHVFLQSKGLLPPDSTTINPATSGIVTTGVSAVILKTSGKKEDEPIRTSKEEGEE